jgi:hypothetical protein
MIACEDTTAAGDCNATLSVSARDIMPSVVPAIHIYIYL